MRLFLKQPTNLASPEFEPAEEIDIASANGVCSFCGKKQQHGIRIERPGGDKYLAAPSFEAQKKWLKNLMKVHKGIKKHGNTKSKSVAKPSSLKAAPQLHLPHRPDPLALQNPPNRLDA
eukprot:GABV01014692.1.p1 GENE.GABV01014692.1~~GABV01014692.1.p1  ORF type:complete len:119 (-),score=39.92 GABV01014692.1:3-359(-)